jgi:hypothetical protein
MRTEYPHSILVVPRRPHPPGPVRCEKTGVWMAAESLKQHFKRRAMVIAERLELELTASSPQTAPPFPSCCPDLFYLQNARDQHALSCVHAKNKTIRYRAIFMRCATRTGGGDRVRSLGTERFQVFCTPPPLLLPGGAIRRFPCVLCRSNDVTNLASWSRSTKNNTKIPKEKHVNALHREIGFRSPRCTLPCPQEYGCALVVAIG